MGLAVAASDSAPITVAQLRDVLLGVGAEPWAKVARFLPNIVAALLILALGYALSRLAQRASSGLLRRLGFDGLGRRVGLDRFLARAGVYAPASNVIGYLLFWLLLLTFLVSAADTLGLMTVSRTIESFVMYLPNVIAALVIFIVGMTVASFVQSVVRSGAESIGVDYAQVLARLAYGTLVIVAASLAIGQLQVETLLLNRIIQIVLVGAAAALAISLAFGTRDIARHIVAGVYLREMYEPGCHLTIGERHGILEEVGSISTRLRLDEGNIIRFPNGQVAD
ncbi:MAG: mechanosensitive ion channel, partial [Myxococcales bacterium]